MHPTPRPIGAGTVADIATRAFANLLTSAGKKSNVCIVISDLWAAYQSGGALINRALDNARQELGRQERNITPVDLAANEIYDILRKCLFKSLPDKAEMGDFAEAFGRKLEEAAKSKTASRGAEAIADEITATYPFHPQLKHVIALFKENEQFKQTRDPGRRPAPHGQPLDGRQCGEGPYREEMVECLVSPLRDSSDFLAAFEELEKVAWHLHHTPEGRYYFDRQENLTKLLQSLAHDTPENQVDDLIRHRLCEMFKPARKTRYDEVLPLLSWKMWPTACARGVCCSS